MPNLAAWAACALGLPLASQVPLPGTSSVTVELSPPSACVECHGTFDVRSAYETWTGSVMGHSARDPLFLSALTEAEKDAPGIGDLCLRCHAPEAWLEGRCAVTDGSALEDDDGGVTCSVCHRMDPSPWLRNGQFLLGEDLDYRGPYADAMSPHHTQQSSFLSSSALCGSCHDLFNPLADRKNLDGTPAGMKFPEQTTYTEWATSAFAREPDGETCQDCHMPEEPGRIAPEGPVRPDRSSHELTGGNVFLLGAIAFLEPGLGLSARLAEGQARAEAFLRTAAQLEATDLPDRVSRGAPFSFTVRVTNLTGHKLPTGYPEGRRVWLSLVSPALGLSRGGFDAVSGEPIDPLAIYQTRHGQFALGVPGHRLALNDTIYLDTRIPPRGMTVTATTAPVGKSYPEVSPGVLAHFDDVRVEGVAPCDPDLSDIPVSIALWYQAVTKAYVDALVAENGPGARSFRLSASFEEADPGPLEMEALELAIAIDPASSCAPPDAGMPDLGAPDATAPPADAGQRDAAGDASDGGGEEDEGCACGATQRSADDGLLAWLLIAVGLAWQVARKVAWKRRSSG